MTANTLSRAIACVATLLIGGCGAVRYPTYYALNVAPSPNPAADAGHRSVAVAVRQFETADYIRQGRTSTGRRQKRSASTTITGGPPILTRQSRPR
jgi:uncharacterized lipoprotein YmbA